MWKSIKWDWSFHGRLNLKIFLKLLIITYKLHLSWFIDVQFFEQLSKAYDFNFIVSIYLIPTWKQRLCYNVCLNGPHGLCLYFILVRTLISTNAILIKEGNISGDCFWIRELIDYMICIYDIPKIFQNLQFYLNLVWISF